MILWFLRFSGEQVPSLYELAKGKGVIYLSTFFQDSFARHPPRVFVAEPDESSRGWFIAKQAATPTQHADLNRACITTATRLPWTNISVNH